MSPLSDSNVSAAISIDCIDNLALRSELKIILRGLERRKSKPSHTRYKTPRSSAEGYLRRKAYALSLQAVEPSMFISLKAATPPEISPKDRLAERPFAWILSLVFGLIGPINKAVRNRIRLIAFELEFAHEHGVAPQNLIGFVYEHGGQKAIQKTFAQRRRT
jgi:hypothetical protein